MRSYTSAAEYVQYAHPVDEALLQRLEWAGQPVSARVAFLQDDLAIMVVEGLLNQIELMRRQHISTLEQIEHVGKRKAPAFEELMVEPKWARAPLQRPQELVWVPAHTIAWVPPRPLKLVSGASTLRSVHMDPVPVHRVQELDIPAEPLAELLLEASDQIMSDAPAVQQEQRSEAPQAPVASSSKAGASSQGGAQVVPELPAPHVQLAAAESHRLSVSVPAPDVPGPSKHLTTDPRTPEQYDGLVATQQKAAAVSKDKGKIVPTLSDESDYGELLSEHKWESEEGEDLQSPIWGKEDKDFVVPQHILTCFTHIKEDGMTALRVMHALDPSQPFDLKQIAQYVLIFGWPGLENTWQGIAFDFAYRMHWQTLFGFALCWALCATSAAKPAVVRQLALVMA
ncbi:hypothetical protein C0995_009268 [Termitomyces sp. Mi166|nr:hypothetical protein C0995_009268 [Termitomyces sp. Mi166\